MKVYKVLQMVVNYGYSLTPALGPAVSPPPPAFLAGFPQYTEAYNKMLGLGYTDPQIMAVFQAWFTHNAYSMGLTAGQAWNCVLSDVNVLCEPPPPPFFPMVVVYVVGVVAVILIAKSLLSPMNFYAMTIDCPNTMYVFASAEAVWLGELQAVSPGGRGLYEMCGEVGGPLIALRKHEPYPPDRADKMWFGGTVLWEGWKFPYFRRYYHSYWWVKYLDVAKWQFANKYYLKHNAADPFLPPGPYIRPGGSWFTPTYAGIYENFPWGLVP